MIGMRVLSTLVILGLLASFCLPALAQKNNPDDEVYDQVRRKLANDPDVKGGAIEVEVQDGVVTLRGKVREEKQKIKAERITKKVKGVKKVVNELQIGTAIE